MKTPFLNTVVKRVTGMTKKPFFFYPVLLLLIELVIFGTNYASGSYLIGWDNIMPEFNLPLNLERSLTSLWQDYRGLGTLDGLSHAANLIHTLVIWILSLLLPQSVLRYVFIHAMHLLGGIGMFLLLMQLLDSFSSGEKRHDKSGSSRLSTSAQTLSITAFFGALFYMVNIGIIQMFYAPLEVFAVHFAALPFITWQLSRTFSRTTKKNLFLLFLISVLFSPQGFVPTVFIVFLILFGALLVSYTYRSRNLKNTVLIGLFVFLANAFWLLPYAYSALHTPAVIQGTKINQIASDEIFYRNKAHGDLLSVFSLRGFMVSTAEYDVAEKEDVYFMQRWLTHTESIPYRIGFTILLLLMLLGIVLTIKQKRADLLPYLAAFMLSFVFLANNTPGFEQFNAWFRTSFPLLGEAFRIPFTKFITLFAFCFSLFLGLAVAYLLVKFADYKKHLIIIFLTILSIISFPIFQGYFTSPYLRLDVPKEYFSVFSYFKEKDPTARIALLPVHTFWNWQYRSWNHRGSGFLWYGLPQPILERAFDPWSYENEQYYNELSSAINKEDRQAVTGVLKKYSIRYLLIDTTILNTLSRQPINFTTLERFLSDEVELKKEAQFGKLLIYSVPFTSSEVSSIPTNEVSIVGNNHLGGRSIGLDKRLPAYITGDIPTIVPVFPNLSTEKLQQDQPFQVTEDKDVFTLTPDTELHRFTSPPVLILPSLFTTEFLVPVEVRKGSGTIIIQPLFPRLRVNGKQVLFPSGAVTLKPKTVTNPTEITFVDTKHVFTETSDTIWTYLLNPFVNAVKLSDGRNEEILLIDTNQFSPDAMEVKLPNEDISSVEVIVPKIASPFTHQDLIKRRVYEAKKLPEALPPVLGKRETNIIENDTGVSLRMKGTSGEVSFYLDNLYHQASYLMTVKATSQEGLPINFYVDNTFQKRAELETILSRNTSTNVLLIPKTERFFQGYGFHFIVKSVGNEISEAHFTDIDLYPFPQETISHMYLRDGAAVQNNMAGSSKNVNFTRNTLSSFTINTPDSSSLVILSQSYNPGWKAYNFGRGKEEEVAWYEAVFPFFFGEEITTHTKVNNWANGWSLTADDQTKVVILYLPQYLQYTGQFLTFSTLIILIILQLRKERRA